MTIHAMLHEGESRKENENETQIENENTRFATQGCGNIHRRCAYGIPWSFVEKKLKCVRTQKI